MDVTTYLLRTLFVHSEGTRLVLEGDAVKALRDGAPSQRLPLNVIDGIVVLSGVDVSTPLLVRCGEDGRTVAFLSRFGKPKAIVEGPLSGRGHLRSLQHARQADSASRDQLACALVGGKLHQMAWGLRQWARDVEPSLASILRTQADALRDQESTLANASRQMALGVEGAGTRRYFDGLARVLRYQEFEGRVRRPATDAVNATLSMLYSLTRMAVHGAIHASGLDPYCGYLHGDRDGQPSLVLDLMEEFRPVADRVAVSLFNKKRLVDRHFAIEVSGAVMLTSEGREVVFSAWHEHRNQLVQVRTSKQPIPQAALPIVQANLFANTLRSGQPYLPLRLAVK
ncbi:MAG: CRISPR-associated endonuclease Cas1 [Propionibacteriaceae bacterium]|nr:CRISPR-associated endonuclease Cas1 [Propionibacteriaceae bacterium]